MIEQDFYAKILSIPTVVAAVDNRVYYGIASQDDRLPLIVIALDSMEREYAADRACKDEYNLSVTVVGGDYQQTRRLQETIADALENDDFGAEAHRPLLTAVSMVSDKKDDAGDADIHTIEMTFNVISRV
jgi:hypothetical protein